MISANALGKILIVDDDANIAELLKVNFGSEGYDVDVESTAIDVDVARLTDTDLVIADAMKQDYNGLDLLRDIKDNDPTAHVSVLLYSSYRSERMVIDALDEGADDYIQKPFSLRELMARAKSVLRRRRARVAASRSRVMSFRSLTVDPDARTARVDDAPVALSKTEFAILLILMRNVDSYVSRIEIHRQVWSDAESAGINERVVDTNISRLRKKLGEVGNCIVSRSGMGYMLAK